MKLPLLGDILFQRYKMNEIMNRILSVGDKFIIAMHLRQLGFTHCACRSITKNKEGIKKIEETGDSNQIKPAFNIIWLMEVLKIGLEEHLLIKYYVIKH